MKTYIAILVGVVALFGVVFVGYKLTSSIKKNPETKTSNAQIQTVNGEVKRLFEGENVLAYQFDVPIEATVSSQMDGALVQVVNGNDLKTSLYFSFEGGRGYSVSDYISNVIGPKVAAVNPTGTTTLGAHDWQGVESAYSEWFITPVLNGEWLVIVESKKLFHEDTVNLLETLSIK